MKYSKKELLSSLEFTLKLTGMGIDTLELKDEETVIIHYESGGSKPVNIACDSHIAIIKDVIGSINY
jgi:hypothetical protein